MGGVPEGTEVSVQPLRAFDGAAVNGFLYARGRSDTVLCVKSPLAATDRLDHMPGDRGVPLREADMPAVDGMVFVAPHSGQGIVPPFRPPASSGSGSAATTTGRRWRRENRRGGSLRALRSGTGRGGTSAEARLAAGCAGRLACRSGLP